MKKAFVLILVFIFSMTLAVSSWAWTWPWSKQRENEVTKEKETQIVPQTPKLEEPQIVMPALPKIPQPQIPQGQEQYSNIKFGMAQGEFVSIEGKGPDTIEIKVKTQQGETLTVAASSTLHITRRISVKDLKPGERIMLHYLTNEDTDTNTALHIMTGEIPSLDIPVPLQQLQQSLSAKPEEESKETE